MLQHLTISRLVRTATAAAMLLVVGGVAEAPAQIVAVVYGEPISELDITQRMRFDQLTTGKPGSRKDILDALVNDKLKIREAKRFGISASDTEVNEAFATMASRMRVKPDQLSQMLERSGTHSRVVKARVRADLAWTRLVRGRYASTLTVGEQDILAALGSKAVGENAVSGYEYTLRPIVFVIPEGSANSVYEARRREAENLRGRFTDCDDGLRMARAMRDVAVRAKIVRTSGDLPEALRKVLDGIPVGRLTPPEVTRHGIEVHAVCAKSESQSDAPERKEAREKLFMQRFETQAERYLAEIRRSAMIEYK